MSLTEVQAIPFQYCWHGLFSRTTRLFLSKKTHSNTFCRGSFLLMGFTEQTTHKEAEHRRNV